MFNNSGLSLNHAPPIKVVLRFFITGAFFGLFAGIFMLFNYQDIFSSTSSNIAVFSVHTLTVGVMTSFMFGALFQMLPVLCGVNVKSPLKSSLRLHFALLVGVVFLLFTLYSGSAVASIWATIFLSIAIFGAFYLLSKELSSIEHTVSSRGMLLSIYSLFIFGLIGITMLLIRAGVNINLDYLKFKELHIHFALFGWLSLLVVSVAFQVIEMFYVTPPYPKIFTKYSTVAIFSLLLIELLLKTTILEPFIVSILGLFATFTLHRLFKRKRKTNDATVWFWFLSMSSLLIFSILLLLDNFLDINIYIVTTLFVYFATSVVFAMSYKIVPFLVWFHLNNQGYFNAPMMHEIIHPKVIRANFYIYLGSFLSVMLSFFINNIFVIGVGLFTISFTILFVNIYLGWEKYNTTIKEGKRFNFPS